MADTLMALSVLALTMSSLLALSTNSQEIARNAKIELNAVLIAQSFIENDIKDKIVIKDGTQYYLSKIYHAQKKDEWQNFILLETEVSVEWNSPKGLQALTISKARIAGKNENR